MWDLKDNHEKMVIKCWHIVTLSSECEPGSRVWVVVCELEQSCLSIESSLSSSSSPRFKRSCSWWKIQRDSIIDLNNISENEGDWLNWKMNVFNFICWSKICAGHLYPSTSVLSMLLLLFLTWDSKLHKKYSAQFGYWNKQKKKRTKVRGESSK